MKAKKINENKLFKPKSGEELKSVIKEGAIVPAEVLVCLINNTETGEQIKVNFDGTWDQFGPVTGAEAITINQGKGFESSLFVYKVDGTFIYTPPFTINSLPNNNIMLLFYANKSSIYIKKNLSK